MPCCMEESGIYVFIVRSWPHAAGWYELIELRRACSQGGFPAEQFHNAF